MARDLIRETPGLVSDPGPFLAPNGALVEADNCVIRRPGNIEPRGRFTFTNDTTASGDGLHITEWNGSTFAIYSGNQVRRDATTTITGPSTFTSGQTWSCAFKDRLALTSDQGVHIIDSASDTTGRRAGLPTPEGFGAYCVAASATATQNWLANTNYVAYRLVYVRYSNNTPLFSAPSNYTLVQNNQGATTYVRLSFTTTFLEDGDEVHIYRSAKGASVPADEMTERAVLKITTGGTYPPNSSATWNDYLDDGAWSGASLYTNAAQDGILLANWRPYHAADIAYYNGMAVYAGHKSPHRVTLTMRDVGANADVDDDTVFRTRTDTMTTTSGSLVVSTTYDPSASFRIGQVVTLAYSSGGRAGSADATFQADSRIASFGPGNQFTMTKTALTTGGVGGACWDWIACERGGDRQVIYAQPEASFDFQNTTGTNRFIVVDDTTADGALGGAQDMARAWAQGYVGTSNHKFRMYWSGDRDRNATFTFESLTVDGSAITVKSTKPYAFDRYCDSATGITSAQDGGTNRVAISKTEQPESVPLLNFVDIGSSTNVIYRVATTSDSLLVFTKEGLWRITGSSFETLFVEPFDPTFVLWDRRLLARGYDQIWAFGRQGPCAVSDSGVRPIGLQVQRLIDQHWNLQQGNESGFPTNAWATCSHEHGFVAFGYSAADGDEPRTASSDAVDWRAWVYNVATEAWTTWSGCRRTSAAIWDASTGTRRRFTTRAVVGGGSSSGTAIYTFSDELALAAPTSAVTGDAMASQSVAVASVVGDTTINVTIGSTDFNARVGDAVIQSGNIYHIVAVTDADTFQVDRAGIGAGSLTWIWDAPVRLKWHARTGGAPDMDKTWGELILSFERFARGYDITLTFEGYNSAQYAITRYAGTEATNTIEIADVRSGFTPMTDAYPMQLRAHVPSSLSCDWAIRPGFRISRAGCFWTLGAMCITGEYVGDRSGFK